MSIRRISPGAALTTAVVLLALVFGAREAVATAYPRAVADCACTHPNHEECDDCCGVGLGFCTTADVCIC